MLVSGQAPAPASLSNESNAARSTSLKQAALPLRSQQHLATLRSTTCPICAAQGQALFDFFVDVQYALSKTQAAQRALAQERGFCSVHTWQFQQVASPQGISEGYAFLVEATATELRRLAGQPGEEIVARLGTFLSREGCAACQVLRETEAAQLDRFLAQIAAPEGQELYAQSAGLCLPHLRTSLAASPPRAVADFLVQEQVRHLEEISEDMRGYVLKRDALRRGLYNRDEEIAWRRALVQLAGEQTVCASCR